MLHNAAFYMGLHCLPKFLVFKVLILIRTGALFINNIIFLFIKSVLFFIISNANLDEMTNNVVSHLGLNCLPTYLFYDPNKGFDENYYFVMKIIRYN